MHICLSEATTDLGSSQTREEEEEASNCTIPTPPSLYTTAACSGTPLSQPRTGPFGKFKPKQAHLNSQEI
ncbi:hypothetical protein K470DRAFT_24136 [Piedraia hortae CBS 480.64]|uniref:Uncharacterized protein n=1 Tax=Piedraia hortae CBS 480.64 TaxID=1314780 RepID=A0A6A7C2W7_9PEZI|nr:hypothetical protein K470DRAFT_24136 [Piedraia hortae CBS 480.64]